MLHYKTRKEIYFNPGNRRSIRIYDLPYYPQMTDFAKAWVFVVFFFFTNKPLRTDSSEASEIKATYNALSP